jgi:hypothetical protein
MRGQRERSVSLISDVSIEERIPANHPLRGIGKLADQALDRLNPTFGALYATEGRPSVPPEQLKAAPEVKPLLIDEHFSVDGTMLPAWASHASLERTCSQNGPAATATRPW